MSAVAVSAVASPPAATANYPRIRLSLVAHAASPTLHTDLTTEWKGCSPTTVAEGGWGGTKIER
jgi:hypothetical protein